MTPQGYEPLAAIMNEAIMQAASGKGSQRHARGNPFADQPMQQITRMVGSGFPLGQAMKKAQEAAGMIGRGEHDAARAELLGAINYLAGAVMSLPRRTTVHCDDVPVSAPMDARSAAWEADRARRKAADLEAAAMLANPVSRS